ncbi:MAG: DNA polymerase III subunit delta [Candidatus Moranbacteria bacterium CG10_big_fil_rev_8_21_14_0_10_35_21]|nr:MAG: DNA polymerase III subunit delta [Candidatus Moranbacteria bacterium CG10_big_fil_rev_8_21_14_0_10_35_21]PJA88664.1 MAG: DNA polymerase III subunit delta [Candidatus Moranbacteria bacterium CG_4_9_14_3_um_filter_36_9]
MVIFLYGGDFFRSGQKLAELKNKFLEKNSGAVVLDFQENSAPENIQSSLEARNLFSTKQLVIFKNAISAGILDSQKEILALLKDKKANLLQDQDLILIIYEAGQPKKNNALFKFLEKNSGEGIKKQNFEKLSGVKMNQWVLMKIKEVDEATKISQEALEKLVVFCGGESGLLDKEIQKLINFSNGKMIGNEEVELLVKANLNSSIFDTIDCLGTGNKKEAFQRIHRHLDQGDDPFYLFSMINYQFRNLLKVSDMRENMGTNEYVLAKATKLHPFVVKKSLAQLKNFSFEKLKNIYQKIGDFDEKIKTGKIEIKLVIDKLIAEI